MAGQFETQQVNGVNSAVTPMNPVADNSDATKYEGLKDVGAAVTSIFLDKSNDDSEAKKYQNLANYHQSLTDIVMSAESQGLSRKQAQQKALLISNQFIQDNPHLYDDFSKITKQVMGFEVADTMLGSVDPEQAAEEEMVKKAVNLGYKVDTKEDRAVALNALRQQSAQEEYFKSIKAQHEAVSMQLERTLKENQVSRLPIENENFMMEHTKKRLEFEATSAAASMFSQYNDQSNRVIKSKVEWLQNNDTVQNRQVVAAELGQMREGVRQTLMSDPTYTWLPESLRSSYLDTALAQYDNAISLVTQENDLKIAKTGIEMMYTSSNLGLFQNPELRDKMTRIGGLSLLWPNNPDVQNASMVLLGEIVKDTEENPDGSVTMPQLWASDSKTVEKNKTVLGTITGTSAQILNTPEGPQAAKLKRELTKTYEGYANMAVKNGKNADPQAKLQGALTFIEKMNDPAVERLVQQDPNVFKLAPSVQEEFGVLLREAAHDPAVKALGSALQKDILTRLDKTFIPGTMGGAVTKERKLALTDVVEMNWDGGAVKLTPKPGLSAEERAIVQEEIVKYRPALDKISKFTKTSALLGGSTDYALEFNKLKARDMFYGQAPDMQALERGYSSEEYAPKPTPQPTPVETPTEATTASRTPASIQVGGATWLADNEQSVREMAAMEGMTPAQTEALVDSWKESVARVQREKEGKKLVRGGEK